MNKITIGNCEYTLTGKEININADRETGNSASISYEVDEDSAMQTLPALGSGTSLLRGVNLDKISITPGIAGIAVVKLSYATPELEDPDDDDGGDGGDGGDEDEGTIVEQSLEGSVSDEPLLTHPKCAGIPDDELEYLKAVQDGARKWEKVAELEKDGKTKLDKNGQPIQKTLQELLAGASENSKVVLKMILRGIVSYRSPGATWREKRIAKSGEINITGLGTIASPAGAPSPTGRNWLLVGKTLSKNSDGKSWTIESIYELSGPNGWDKTLYS